MERESSLFPCPVCRKIFNNKYNLLRHIACCHEGLKRFSCDYCGLRLASKQTKVEHQYLHTGERPYVCKFPGCGERFRQSSQLSVHSKTHIAEIEVENRLNFAEDLPGISSARAESQQAVILPLPDQLKGPVNNLYG